MSARYSALIFAALLAGAPAAWSQQQPGQDFPDGPGKSTVVKVCHGCHDINRARAGYSAEGWLTLQAMMENMGAPIPPEEWPAVTAYLIKSFPERQRPSAAIVAGPVQATIKMWEV